MLTFFLVVGLILLLLLLLLVALLCIPATLRLQLRDTEPTVTVYLLGIPFRLFPKKKKLIKKSQAKKAASSKDSPLPPLPKNADAEAILRYAKTLLSEICRFTGYCTARLHRLQVIPPAMDADKAVLCHTALSGCVAALLELADKNTKLIIMSRDAIEIRPNFTNAPQSIHLDITLSFAPYRALFSLLRLTERLQNI